MDFNLTLTSVVFESLMHFYETLMYQNLTLTSVVFELVHGLVALL